MDRRLKYERLAEEIAHLIRSGTYQPGAPVPSVRTLAGQKGLSVSTVLQAYYLLEAQGLIQVRARSGFYVSLAPRMATPEPDISTPALDPAKVSVRELVTMLLQDALNPDLIPLGAAYPDPDLSEAGKLNRLMAAIARDMGNRSGRYDMPPGCEPLRVQIARRAAAGGMDLAPGDLITTCGCTEAVNICLRAVCQPGDTVALESPICMDTLQALETLGLRALEIPTHPRDGISLEALTFALDNNPVRACLVISNFNNPLGSLMPEAHKKELVEILARRGVPLIENDIFGDLGFGEQRPPAAKAFDRRGLVMLCSSFSKSLFPGFRVGWTAPGRFLSRVEWLKYTTTTATATLPQLALAEFMAGGGFQQHLRRARKAYAQRLGSIRQAVIRHFPKGIRVTRPAGGFLLWVQLPPGTDSLELYKRALASGIAITPGHLFSASDRYRDFIRLNAAQWSEEWDWAMRRLGRLTVELGGG